MVAKIRNGSAGEPNEVPGVEMSRVEHGVLGEEQERLDLVYIARHEGAVGVRQRTRDELDTIGIKFVAIPAALRGRAYRKYHPQQPVIGILSGSPIFPVEIIQEGEQRRVGEGREQVVYVCHVIVDDGIRDLPSRQPSILRLGDWVVRRRR